MGQGYKERLLQKEGVTPKTSCHGPGLERATPLNGRNHSKDVLPWTWAIKSDSFERKESLQTRPTMGLGFKERLPRKEGITPDTSCHGPGLERATPSKGRNHSKDVLPWAWARKCDSFERKESLQTRPAMGLGFEERLLQKEGINPNMSCHGPGLLTATSSKGRNHSKDVLPWAWAVKSDSFERKESLQTRPAWAWATKSKSFERKESLQTRPAMDLGYKE
jgi:hypothetical protein